MGNDRSGTNNCASPYLDTRQNYSVCPNPYIILNRDWSRHTPLLVNSFVGSYIVIMICNETSWCKQDMLSDRYTLHAINFHSLTQK
jgi:hypothetical protein